MVDMCVWHTKFNKVTICCVFDRCDVMKFMKTTVTPEHTNEHVQTSWSVHVHEHSKKKVQTYALKNSAHRNVWQLPQNEQTKKQDTHQSWNYSIKSRTKSKNEIQQFQPYQNAILFNWINNILIVNTGINNQYCMHSILWDYMTMWLMFNNKNV